LVDHPDIASLALFFSSASVSDQQSIVLQIRCSKRTLSSFPEHFQDYWLPPFKTCMASEARLAGPGFLFW
jgi:hypothetical protein